MANNGISIADLFASLNLDASDFASGLQKAQVDMRAAADVISTGTDGITRTFDSLVDVLGEVAANSALKQMSQDSMNLDANIMQLAQDIEGIVQLSTEWNQAIAENAVFTAQATQITDAWNDALVENAARNKDASDQLAVFNTQAQTGSSAVIDMVQQLELLATALAVTNELRDLGEAALEAFGNVEKSTIALTALSGSASIAFVTIDQLKTLSVSDALSFPALVDAQQRLTAFGFSAAQIPDTLIAIANAAGATNRSFDSTANSLERIAISGTLMSRQLATVGLTMEDIGKVLGVTASQVTASFKLLDQDTRLAALTAALQKYGDVAAQVAAGLLGQWQSVQNQILFLLQGIGEALAPVAEQILSLVSTDILPFLQSLVDNFNQLSTPVKDFAVGIALAVAAVVPAIGALAAIGLAAQGLAAVMPILETLWEAFGASVIITSPLLIPIAAGIAAIGYALANTNKSLDSWSQTFKDDFAGIADFISPVTDKIKALASAILDVDKAVAGFAADNALPQWTKDLASNAEAWVKDTVTIDNFNAGMAFVTGHTTDARNTLTTLDETLNVLSSSTDSLNGKIALTPAQILAAKQAADASAAAYQSMSDAATSLYNSSVKLWTALPESYDVYIQHLSDGGKSAQSSLSGIETAILNTTNGIADAWGKPQQDLQDMLVGLTALQARAEAFADNDAFTKTAVKIDALTDKYREQVTEIETLDPTMVSFFDDMSSRAANASSTLDKFSLSTYIEKWLAGLKQVDDAFTAVGVGLDGMAIKAEAASLKLVLATSTWGIQIAQVGSAWQELVATETVVPGDAAMKQSYDDTTALRTALAGLRLNYDDLTKASVGYFDQVATNNATTLPALEAAFSAASAAITKLATYDLPSAVNQYNIYIRALQNVGAAQGLIYAEMAKQLQLQITLGTQQGLDENAEVIQLAKINELIKEQTFDSQALGNVYVGVYKSIDDLFTQSSTSLSKLIVDGGKFGDTMMAVLNTVEKEILNVLIGTVFKALENEIESTTGLFSKFSDSISAGLGVILKQIGLLPKLPTGGAGAPPVAGSTGTLASLSPSQLPTFTGAQTGTSIYSSPIGPELPPTLTGGEGGDIATQMAASILPLITSLGAATGAVNTLVPAVFNNTQQNMALGNVYTGSFEPALTDVGTKIQFEGDQVQDLGDTVKSNVTATEGLTGGVKDNTTAIAAVPPAMDSNTTDVGANTDATTSNTGELGDLTKDLGGLGGGGGGGGASAGAASGDDSGSGLGGLLGTGITNPIGLGVQIAGTVVAAIQGGRTNSILYSIEQLNLGMLNQLEAIQITLDTYQPNLLHLVDIWGAILQVNAQIVQNSFANDPNNPTNQWAAAHAGTVPVVQIADTSGNTVDPATTQDVTAASATTDSAVAAHGGPRTSATGFTGPEVVAASAAGAAKGTQDAYNAATKALAADPTNITLINNAAAALTAYGNAEAYVNSLGSPASVPQAVIDSWHALQQVQFTPDQIAGFPTNGEPTPIGTPINNSLAAPGTIQPGQLDAYQQAMKDQLAAQFALQTKYIQDAAKAAVQAGSATQAEADQYIATRMPGGGAAPALPTPTYTPTPQVMGDFSITPSLPFVSQTPIVPQVEGAEAIQGGAGFGNSASLGLSGTGPSTGFNSLATALQYISTRSGPVTGNGVNSAAIVPVTIISNQSPDNLARAVTSGLRKRGVRVV